MHLRRAAPRGGLARGGWRSAVALDVGVLRNELASSSPCGDERAAGPTRFLSLGRVLCVSGFSSRRAWPWGRMGFATVPRAWAAVGFCVDRCDAKAAGGGVVGSRWRTAPLRARTLGGFFSPPAWVEVHLAASQCWKTVRVRPAVCSQVRLVGSLVDCCTLRAVGRRFCVARGPSSCGGRGTSWWALRAGRLLFNIVGRSMSLTGNLAGIFPLFGAPLPSLCRPRGCGVRSRRGGQGSAALCGRL
mgnify:CR=1 FL=1